MRLEVEIDHTHARGMITCWIFRVETTERTNLSVQQLYNFGQRARWGKDQGLRPEDETLVKLLWTIVSKPHILKANLKALKVPIPTFEGWLTRFADTPDRFIDRATKASAAQSAESATLLFPLDHRGNKTQLHAVAVLPDKSRYPYHSLRFVPKGKQARYAVDGRTLTIDFPIPRELVDQLFAKQDPVVDTQKLVTNLPGILNGRLDLVAGDVVHDRRQAKTVLVLEEDGADICAEVHVGAARPVRPDLQDVRILKNGRERFQVLSYESADLASVAEALNSAGATVDRNKFRIAGDVDRLHRFGTALDALPDSVSVRSTPGLTAFTQGDAALTAGVMAVESAAWCDLQVTAEAAGISLTPEQLSQATERGQTCFRSAEGAWLRLSNEAVHLFRKQIATSGLRMGKQRVARTELSAVSRALVELPRLRSSQTAKALLKQAAAQPEITEFAPLAEFAGELRSYQLAGCQFLRSRLAASVSCLLADDMGLGKTVQILAYVQAVARAGWRGLVVCPASVVGVWQQESQRFTPSLKVQSLVGSPEQRKQALADSSNQLLICTYAVMRNDIQALRTSQWDLAIFDEAQQLKNPDAAVSIAARALPAAGRVAVTGTPLENRLRDLWSLIDLLNPGYLGRQRDFEDEYTFSARNRVRLQKQLAPLILRRTKEEVAPDLPARTEELLTVPMTDQQRRLYDETRRRAREEGGGPMQVFAQLTRLRQICCHPALVSGSLAAAESAKLGVLMERLEELRDAGHSSLVFSQFVKMLHIIEAALKAAHIPYQIITGDTPAAVRQKRIETFTKADIPMVFLLSLRAAGTGLTLTKADYVFLYDPWWNPAVEQQAIDRAHRIGQDKPVVAYRLATADSVEERVLKLQQEKRALFAEVIDGATALPPGLSLSDMASLLDD